MVSIFNPTIFNQHNTWLEVRYSSPKSENDVRGGGEGRGGGKERSSTTTICNKLAINLLAKDLLYHTIIYQS